MRSTRGRSSKDPANRGAAQTINPAFTPDFINTIYDVVRWASTKDNIPGYLKPIFASARAKVSAGITERLRRLSFLRRVW